MLKAEVQPGFTLGSTNHPLWMPALTLAIAVPSVTRACFAMVRRMPLLLALAFAMVVAGCTDEYSSPDRRVGPDGEPPPKLPLVYERQFAVADANYLRALGEIHSLLLDARLSPTFRAPCFTNVLDIHVVANTVRSAKAFPCVALLATKGDAVEGYIRTRIDAVKFNWDHKVLQVTFTVQFYGNESLVPGFISITQPKLQTMYLRAGALGR